ncbi:hypothetical protein C9374_013263 [Naegleria lovaniensis]|uniref:Uncharacterized protein n=1 Tax=Naegleria lovaniensis TaxID=51637 RepID=A0AA88KN51_NAELO|nr:uncharacterized protein C9374_013263 [Naegleria lovaniensis]KAG2391778.1 hypothetical protein C9374_013263 [Naegleria lovaniensis]
MGNVAPRLDGSFIERSGRIWVSSPSGNTFRWIQDGTGRVATGIAVPLNGGLSWAVFITFDGNTHWKLTPSLDGSQLVGPSDIFTRMTVSNMPVMNPCATVITDVPTLIGASFVENSGKYWSCLMHEGGYFTLQNQSDGRKCEGYVVRDPTKFAYVMYLVFHNNGTDVIMRVETNDMNVLPLPNGDVFRRNNVSYNTGIMYPPQQPSIPTMPSYPQVMQPNQGYTPNYQQPYYPQQPQIYQQPQVQVHSLPMTRILRIGGGKDGVTHWTRWQGKTNSSVDGWEMKFKVDQFGNVSGSNKNDNAGAITKHYSGTFINNYLDVKVTWDDGRAATYKGSVTGNKVRIDFVITSVGTQGGCVGDAGVNTGTLFETFEDPNIKHYRIGGGKDGLTSWTRWKGVATNSTVAGWEMKFQVDQYGNVSGSNKNDGSSITKYYSGTFINNYLDVKVTWDDGRAATYKGSVTGNKVRIDFVITSVGTQGGCVGDAGVNTGTLVQI